MIKLEVGSEGPTLSSLYFYVLKTKIYVGLYVEEHGGI